MMQHYQTIIPYGMVNLQTSKHYNNKLNTDLDKTIHELFVHNSHSYWIQDNWILNT